MVKCFMPALLLALAIPALAAQDVLIEAELEPAEVHVHAQAVYRLRVYHAIDLRDLRITGPSARLADFRAIGADRTFETQRGGRRYRVHERRYAVFPFASGTLTLAGARATARASTANGRNMLRLEAPERALTVLPANIEADGTPWLPARSLTLSEQWSAAANGAQHRTIRIDAVGVDAAQLPALPVAVDGMTVQAQAPRLENRFAGENNIAMREQTFVMTPARRGDVVVPELKLRWWQVQADSPAQATLPARTLRIETPDLPLARDADTAAMPPLLAGLAIAAMPICLLAFAGWRKRTAWRAARQLRIACQEGDARAVRDALLRWAETLWHDTPPVSLAEFADRLHDRTATHALQDLEHTLYGRTPVDLGEAELLATVRAVKEALRNAGMGRPRLL